MRPFRRQGVLIGICTAILLGSQRAESSDEVALLPHPVAEVAVADSGRLLVVQLSGEDALRIYDPLKRKFVGRVQTQASDCVFGAGGKTLVFYRPSDAVLESWNLETLSRLESVEFFDPGPILRIVMGSANGDDLLVRATTGSGALDQTVLQLLDAKTLRPISRRLPGSTGHSMCFRDFVHYRTDRFLRKVSEWATSHSPSGVGILVCRGRELDAFYEHSSEGYLAMGDDGNIYTETGKVLTNKPESGRSSGPQDSLVSRGAVPGCKPFPGIGGVFLLGVDDTETVHVFEMSSRRHITDIGKLPPRFGDAEQPGRPEPGRGRRELAEEWAQTTLTLDKRIVFAPELGYVLFIPYGNDTIIVREFDIREIIRDIDGAVYITSSPLTDAKSGAEWQYEPKAVASAGGVKFSLAKAPEGMVLDEEAGRILWRIPAGIEGTAAVVVEASDDSGHVKRQEFTISFR